MRNNLLAVTSIATIAVFAVAPLPAQSVRVVTPSRNRVVFTTTSDDGRAMLGISTSSGSTRDTLGLLVASVVDAGPAAKAGIEEGDRIQAINGTSLKVSRDDAGDDEMGAIMQRRLSRELGKVTAGDEVTVTVWTGGQVKSIKVKTVAAKELTDSRMRVVREADERAVIGVDYGFTGSKRDTAGVFVNGVTEDGPAEKAGIVEGDRIAAINGVSLKLSKDDLDDGGIGGARLNRLSREMAKAKPGDVMDLTVVSGGRSRAVKVTTVKSSSLKSRFGTRGFLFRVPEAPLAPLAPLAPRAPLLQWRSFEDGADVELDMGALRREVEQLMREELPRVRVEVRQGLEQARKQLQSNRLRVHSRSVRM